MNPNSLGSGGYNISDPNSIKQLMLAAALVAPSFAGPLEGALGGILPGAMGGEQLSNLEHMYQQSGIDKGGVRGLLSQLGGQMFGGLFNPQAHAYLQARNSTANSIANATGQDPNAVLSSLPDFRYSPQSAQAAFQNVGTPLGQSYGGNVLSNLNQ